MNDSAKILAVMAICATACFMTLFVSLAVTDIFKSGCPENVRVEGVK